MVPARWRRVVPAARTCASPSGVSAPAAPAIVPTPARRAAFASCSTVSRSPSPTVAPASTSLTWGAVERIRVVRSNTSALFGSASGGLIQLSTAGHFTSPFTEATHQFRQLRIAATACARRAATRLGTIAAVAFRHPLRRLAPTQCQRNDDAAEFHRVESGRAHVARGGAVRTRNHTEQPGALTRAELEADPRQANPDYVRDHSRRENTLGRMGVRVKHEFSPRQDLQVAGFVEPKSLHRSERGRFRDFNCYSSWVLMPTTHTIFSSGEPACALDDRRRRSIPGRHRAVLGAGAGRLAQHRPARQPARGDSQLRRVLRTRRAARRAMECRRRRTLRLGALHLRRTFMAPHSSDQRDLDRVSPRLSLSYRFKRGPQCICRRFPPASKPRRSTKSIRPHPSTRLDDAESVSRTRAQRDAGGRRQGTQCC